MNKILVIDAEFAKKNAVNNFISLLPGYKYQPDWTLSFEKHTIYNKEIIKTKNQLAELFSKEIYSPLLGYKVESCKAMFLNMGGVITFVIADRLFRLNKLLATYPMGSLQLPKVDYKHNPSISYKEFFYNIIEQDPYFNQWLINELLPELGKVEILKKVENSKLIIAEKNDTKTNIYTLLYRFAKKNIFNYDVSLKKRVSNIKNTTKSITNRLWRNSAEKLSHKKGSIIIDTPFQSVMSQFPIFSFFWPFGPFSVLSINLKNIGPEKPEREIFASLNDEVARIFKNMLINSGDKVMISENSLLNISNIISKLLPYATTELAKVNCKNILSEFKPFIGKTYFCSGSYHGDIAALSMFACKELNINVLATQHSAWGGYLANGSLVSELLIAGSDDYISFGWHEKANDGTSSWRNKIIPMPSPVLSEIRNKKGSSNIYKHKAHKKHVLLCLGFLYRFPSIYNSSLRWDTVNKWSDLIDDIIKKLSDSGIKITLIMYNNYVAETLQDFMQQWMKTGGKNIVEHPDHNSDVRPILSKDDFEDQYDAVIWDVPTGGFTESIANNLKTFSLWNQDIIKSLPEGEPFINDLIKNKVLFEDGSALLKSMEQLYKNPEWYQSDEVQVSINSFMERFAFISPSWKTEWKKLLKNYS